MGTTEQHELSPKYQCPRCLKHYKRREHLQRHCAAHSDAKPHRCTSCPRSFQRLDVLRRHQRTCEARASGVIAATTKRWACDLCVRHKKACSAGQPCQNCKIRNQTCQYSFGAEHERSGTEDISSSANDGVWHDESNDVGISLADLDSTASAKPDDAFSLGSDDWWMDFSTVLYPQTQSFIEENDASWTSFLNLMTDNSVPETVMTGKNSGAGYGSKNKPYTFRFLDNFTSQTGLIASFDCGSPELREQTIAQFVNENMRPFESSEQPVFLDRCGGSSNDQVDDNLAAGRRHSRLLSLSDQLMVQTHQIVRRISEVAQVKTRSSTPMRDWTPLREQQCFEFFSPLNIQRCVALYWAIWHPNVNIVHRPTFDPCEAKPSLLAAMVVIGK